MNSLKPEIQSVLNASFCTNPKVDGHQPNAGNHPIGRRVQSKGIPDGEAEPARARVLIDHHQAKNIYNLSRSSLYRETAAGHFQAVKIRGRTFWLVASIEARIAAAPSPILRANSAN